MDVIKVRGCSNCPFLSRDSLEWTIWRGCRRYSLSFDYEGPDRPETKPDGWRDPRCRLEEEGGVVIAMEPRTDAPKYDIIGDIHGCWGELLQLMDKLGWEWDDDRQLHTSPDGRQAVFVGDIADRGPHSDRTIAYGMDMVRSGAAQWVMGNHCDKLRRWAKGNPVKPSHGLDKTIRQVEAAGFDKQELFRFLSGLPYWVELDEGRVVVAHASWHEGMRGGSGKSPKGRDKALCIYGPTTGKTRPDGLPDRIDWAAKREGSDRGPWIVYGHQPYQEPRKLNRTFGIDTGCVFGGHLTALRWPEMEIVQVPALDAWDRSKPEFSGKEEKDD